MKYYDNRTSKSGSSESVPRAEDGGLLPGFTLFQHLYGSLLIVQLCIRQNVFKM